MLEVDADVVADEVDGLGVAEQLPFVRLVKDRAKGDPVPRLHRSGPREPLGRKGGRWSYGPLGCFEYGKYGNTTVTTQQSKGH